MAVVEGRSGHHRTASGKGGHRSRPAQTADLEDGACFPRRGDQAYGAVAVVGDPQTPVVSYRERGRPAQSRRTPRAIAVPAWGAAGHGGDLAVRRETANALLPVSAT